MRNSVPHPNIWCTTKHSTPPNHANWCRWERMGSPFAKTRPATAMPDQRRCLVIVPVISGRGGVLVPCARHFGSVMRSQLSFHTILRNTQASTHRVLLFSQTLKLYETGANQRNEPKVGTSSRGGAEHPRRPLTHDWIRWHLIVRIYLGIVSSLARTPNTCIQRYVYVCLVVCSLFVCCPAWLLPSHCHCRCSQSGMQV